MEDNQTQTMWKAVLNGVKWQVFSSENKVIATIEKGPRDEANAKLIAASPMMYQALSGVIQLLGEEDLPDNGELSGAAICDLARSALAAASGDTNWPFP